MLRVQQAPHRDHGASGQSWKGNGFMGPVVWGGGESQGAKLGGGVRAKLGQEKRGTWYAVETLNPTPVSLNAQP